jgi:hypothetical protein
MERSEHSVDSLVLHSPSRRRMWLLRGILAIDSIWKCVGGIWQNRARNEETVRCVGFHVGLVDLMIVKQKCKTHVPTPDARKSARLTPRGDIQVLAGLTLQVARAG